MYIAKMKLLLMKLIIKLEQVKLLLVHPPGHSTAHLRVHTPMPVWLVLRLGWVRLH